MINYDFVEIGTCDFDTLIERCDAHAVGICVEPIKYYLDKLPNRPNVIKENSAISFDNSETDIDIYYIPVDVLRANKLPMGLSGCNRIGAYHPHHVSWKITHLVRIETVRQISLANFFAKHDIGTIQHLKLDTEGGDCFILDHLIAYLQDKDLDLYPKKITFETNLLTNMSLIHSTVNRFVQMGYRIQSRNNWVDDGNTVLVR
jgi:hypothetical protein